MITLYNQEKIFYDIVLDFTIDSGSIGVACKNLNRNFIDIEINKDYFDIAKERIENA